MDAHSPGESLEGADAGWAAALGALGGASPTSVGDGADEDATAGWDAALEALGGSPATVVSTSPSVAEGWGVALQGLGEDDSMSSCSSASDGAAAQGTALLPMGPGHSDHVLSLSHNCCRVSDQDLCVASMRAVDAILENEAPVTNMTSESVALQVDRDSLREKYRLSAAVALEFERQSWHRLEESMAAAAATGQVELLLYIDCASYDSADFFMKSVVNIVEQIQRDPRPGGLAGPAVFDSIELQETNDTKKKVLQVETNSMMLVRVKAACAGGVGSLALIRGNTLTWLSICDRNSSECYKAALGAQWIGTHHANAFNVKLRLACTDGAGSIGKTERWILDSRPGWVSLHFTCRVHMIYNILTRVYDLRPADVSGMLAVALSLGAPGQIALFRMAARRVLARKLKLVSKIVLTGAQKEYRNIVMKAFGLDQPQCAELRLILERSAGGDWQDRESWVYLAAPGETRVDALRSLYQDLVPALFGHCPRVLMRSRWTGCRESFRDVGLPLAVHGLLEDTFEEYMALVRDPRPPAPVALPTVEDVEQPEEAPGDSGDPPGPFAIVPVPLEEPEGEPVQAAPQVCLNPVTADENRANRGNARTWLRTRPTYVFIYMALFLNPLMDFMHSELDMSSAEYDTQQMHAQLRGDRPLSEKLAGRKWPLLEVAKLSLESQCLKDIHTTRDAARCGAFPASVMNLALESLACRFVARSACALHHHFLSRFNRFPHRLFLLVVDPAYEDTIKASCESCRDGFSADFIRRHGEDLRNPVAIAELVLIVMVARVSTVLLECRNAQIRRLVESLSVQTTKPSLSLVSAKFLLRKLALRERAIKQPPGFRRVRQRIARARAEQKPRLSLPAPGQLPKKESWWGRGLESFYPRSLQRGGQSGVYQPCSRISGPHSRREAAVRGTRRIGHTRSSGRWPFIRGCLPSPGQSHGQGRRPPQGPPLDRGQSLATACGRLHWCCPSLKGLGQRGQKDEGGHVLVAPRAPPGAACCSTGHCRVEELLWHRSPG